MTIKPKTESPIAEMMDEIGRAARRAAALLATTDSEQRNAALEASAAAIRQGSNEIITANVLDMDAAKMPA